MSGGTGLEAIDRASEGDRLYFERHPGCNRYFRPRHPGEFGALEDEVPVTTYPWVEVVQVRPGVRTRQSVSLAGLS